MIRPAFPLCVLLTLSTLTGSFREVPAMTPEQTAGQLLGIGFYGRPTERELETWIAKRTPGLVVLYRSNVLDPKEMSEMTGRIAAASPSSDLAPLLGIDQEGGTVIRYGPAMIPGAMALGAAGSAALAHRAGVHVGSELRAAGIDLNLAPVADLSAFPDGSDLGTRSFGRRPDEVALLVSSYLRGLKEAGILAVVKHFPGHGFADHDPHEDVATAVRSAQQLRDEDLTPFIAAFDAGADGIMTAHVAYPAMEQAEAPPATLSEALLIDLLREELGFDGLVITDVLHMKGVAGEDRGELAVKALEAGADIVLAPNVREREMVFQAVLEAIRSGRLGTERVERSIGRIERARRARNLAPSAPAPGPAPTAVAEEVARRAVTEVGAKRTAAAALFIGVDGPIAQSFPADRRIVIPFQPSSNQIKTYAARIEHAIGDDGWVAAIQNRSQAALVREVRTRVPESPLTLIALGSPYDVVGIGADRVLFAFGFHDISQNATLEVLRGRRCAPGRLPVEVPGIGKIGAGEAGCVSSEAREAP